MNDEEKYKIALEKAKTLYGSSEPMSGCSVILETIFPELKENEGERIRKEIIDHINSMKATTISDLREKQFQSWIAWLEKQGERKYTQKDVDNAYLKGVSTAKCMFEKQKAKKEAVQEVDLDEEFDKCCENYTFDDECEVHTAKHFFKLGFKIKGG